MKIHNPRRHCPRCKQEFISHDPARRFCSRRCQKKEAEIRRRVRLGTLIRTCRTCGAELARFNPPGERSTMLCSKDPYGHRPAKKDVA